MGSTFHVKSMLPTNGAIKMTWKCLMCVANLPSSLLNHSTTKAPDRTLYTVKCKCTGRRLGEDFKMWERRSAKWPHKSQGSWIRGWLLTLLSPYAKNSQLGNWLVLNDDFSGNQGGYTSMLQLLVCLMPVPRVQVLALIFIT